MDKTVVHFEIPSDNPEKLSAFYKNLFDWKFEKAPMEGVEYWMITTKAGEDSPGVNGGMMKKMDPNQRPCNYVLVDSVDDYCKKLQSLGGKIVVPKTPIPKMGAFAVALDPENNPFGLFESSGEM